jgi:hypothetical protein
MKKFIRWLLIIIVLGGGGYLAWHLLSPYKKVEAYSVIPGRPVFIIETDDSYRMWESLTKNKIWEVLSKHTLFARFEKGINMIDSVIQRNDLLARYIGKRNMVVSMHILANGSYDFAYAIDLERISKLLPVKDYISGFLEDYKIVTSSFEGQDIHQLRSKKENQVIYLSFLNNIMVASFSKELIESSVLQLKEPGLSKDFNFFAIRERVKETGLFRFYISYAQLDNYLNTMLVSSNPNLRQLSKSLLYSGLAFDIKDGNLIACEGYTNFNDSIVSVFRAMIRSGKGKTNLPDVLPQQTASSVSLGFEKFTVYFDNMFANLEEVPKSYAESEATIKQIEKYLKIDIRKNIMDWIADEIAMVHIAPMGLGRDNEFAIMLKTKNINDARENLDYVMKQIRKKTPVKFQEVEYKGYTINYLSMKGFFKILLGKYFQNLEKPYYTFISDYVVFSNHPQTLKVIINGVTENKLLADIEDYKPFSNNFSRRSNILAIIHTEQFLKSIRSQVKPSTWTDIEKNKEYILCFPYFGFQLEADGAIFKTRLMVQFNEKRTEETIENDFIPADSLVTEGDSTDNVENLKNETQEDKINKMLSAADDFVADNPNLKIYREFYPDGKIKVEFELKNGFRHGSFTEYYENGKVKIKGQYVNDQKDGIWKIYDENETLLMKTKFRNGKAE